MESIPQIALESAQKAYAKCDDRVRAYMDKLFDSIIDLATDNAVKAAEAEYDKVFETEERARDLYGAHYLKRTDEALRKEAETIAMQTADDRAKGFIEERSEHIIGALAEDEYWASDEGLKVLEWKREREAGAVEALPDVLIDEERLDLFLAYYDHPTMACRVGSLITHIWDQIQEQYGDETYDALLMRSERFATHRTRLPPGIEGDPFSDHTHHHWSLGIRTHPSDRPFTLDEWTNQ